MLRSVFVRSVLARVACCMARSVLWCRRLRVEIPRSVLRYCVLRVETLRSALKYRVLPAWILRSMLHEDGLAIGSNRPLTDILYMITLARPLCKRVRCLCCLQYIYIYIYIYIYSYIYEPGVYVHICIDRRQLEYWKSTIFDCVGTWGYLTSVKFGLLESCNSYIC